MGGGDGGDDGGAERRSRGLAVGLHARPAMQLSQVD